MLFARHILQFAHGERPFFTIDESRFLLRLKSFRVSLVQFLFNFYKYIDSSGNFLQKSSVWHIYSIMFQQGGGIEVSIIYSWMLGMFDACLKSWGSIDRGRDFFSRNFCFFRSYFPNPLISLKFNFEQLFPHKLFFHQSLWTAYHMFDDVNTREKGITKNFFAA